VTFRNLLKLLWFFAFVAGIRTTFGKTAAQFRFEYGTSPWRERAAVAAATDLNQIGKVFVANHQSGFFFGYCAFFAWNKSP